ncbi:MAG: hypothetical protein R3C03_03340 [Pirellulaceae bacterium]
MGGIGLARSRNCAPNSARPDASVPALANAGLDVSGVTEYERRRHERWKRDHQRLADFPIQYYRIVFAPLVVDNEESVVGDVPKPVT